MRTNCLTVDRQIRIFHPLHGVRWIVSISNSDKYLAVASYSIETHSEWFVRLPPNTISCTNRHRCPFPVPQVQFWPEPMTSSIPCIEWHNTFCRSSFVSFVGGIQSSYHRHCHLWPAAMLCTSCDRKMIAEHPDRVATNHVEHLFSPVTLLKSCESGKN